MSSKNAVSPPITDSRLAALCSEQTKLAFLNYTDRFREITSRARQRFLDRDWSGGFADASQRLHLYTQQLEELANKIQDLLGERLRDRKIWMATKAVYSSFLANHPHWEIAESFFNSLTRRIFDTEGVDQAIEFVDTDFDAPPTTLPGNIFATYEGECLTRLLASALADVGLECPVQEATQRILDALPPLQGETFCLELIAATFFRSQGAYQVGRVTVGSASLPVALCLRNDGEGNLRLDAVLVREKELSILFSYTRAYFRVAVDCPYELVRQLHALLPRKPLGDLYNAIGFHRHGKTQQYRDFVAHLRQTQARFVIADGARGMVMLVFTLPDYDVVFKLIKDRFDYPKEVSKAEVKQRYRLVFEHDRAGRLVEAHEFEHLRIPRRLFEESLLEILLRDTAETTRLEGDDLLISHAYVERRVRPLNLYLYEASQERAIAAALDYGQAIKDLAASNIFAGDIFTKNFGVTRTGRVVFYDYDELCFLTECNFRDLPQPTTPEQEMAAEPWFSVRPNDIFPEEFIKFLGIPEPAWSEFKKEHGDLFTADFWRGVQARLRAGEIPEVIPYKPASRIN